MNLVAGDVVRWVVQQFSDESARHESDCRRGPSCAGFITRTGTIEYEFYSAVTGRHTFVIRLANGERIGVMGSELYPNIIMHTPSPQHDKEASDKYFRSQAAKELRNSFYGAHDKNGESL